MTRPMDRPAKSIKLEDFKRKVPALSASASAVLQEVRESGLPGLVHRKHVREATIKTLEKHDAYGPIMNGRGPGPQCSEPRQPFARTAERSHWLCRTSHGEHGQA